MNTTSSVDLAFEVRDATSFEVKDEQADIVDQGPITAPKDVVKVPLPCDKRPHTYTMTVSGKDGRRSPPRSVTVQPITDSTSRG